MSKREPKDHGTPESVARRFALVGNLLDADGRLPDPALAAYPLGILLARGLVDRDMHDMGCRYAGWMARALGRRPNHTAAGGGGEMDSEEIGGRTIEEVVGLWRDAAAILKAVSRQSYDAVTNIAFYERAPDWAKLHEWHHLKPVQRGLTALVQSGIGVEVDVRRRAAS